MRVSWQPEGRSWTLRIRLDADDLFRGPGQGTAMVSLATTSCTVTLPVRVDEPHPDLLALAALLVVRPWVATRISFDRPVSPAFSAALAEAFTIDATTVDDALSARVPGERVGLSYSGGVDSIAVSELLPRDTPYIHLERVPHPHIGNQATHVRPDQIARLVRRAGRRGRQTLIVKSDLDFLCAPSPQLPSWPALAIGALLLADHLGLGSLAFGTVLESAYLRGGRRYVASGGRGPWIRLLDVVGLPACRPAAGLTEVGTLMITSTSDLADLAQSCLRGAAGRPCLACVKCARKELLAAAVEGRALDDRIRERLQPGDPVARDFDGPPPLHMQNCVEYVVARLTDLDGTLLAHLAKRMDVTLESTSWNERFYPRALQEEVPERWREPIARELAKRVRWMDDKDVGIVESWDGARRLRD